MAGIKGKNTKPEILVRKHLHAMGIRFRIHNVALPGRPDIVLAKYKSAIFVQGCFWHGHRSCSMFRLPKSRTAFWGDKIGSNTLRDETSRNELLRQGWKVIYVWECALKGPGRLSEEELKLRISGGVRSGDIKFTEVRGILFQPAS